MGSKSSWISMLIVAIVSVSGCSQVEDGRQGVQESGGGEGTDLMYQVQSLGSLCTSLSGCFVFCKNNGGQCTQFCSANPSHPWCRIPPSASSEPWVPDEVTQPLPEGSSKVRLILPAPLDRIDLKKIGGYGAHIGGHGEGLDHEWIQIEEGNPVLSWADGEVVYARPNNDPQDNEYRIIIYYGDGLWGEHMHVKTILVKEGDRVKAGDPVAYGEDLGNSPGYHNGEFNVADQHRRDGVGYWYKFAKGAMLVSPFDYLQDDAKQQLAEKWRLEVIQEYLTENTSIFGVVPTPWEPYLSNPLMFHSKYPGELAGEWFLRSRPWSNDRVPDILVFLPSNTKYYPRQRVLGTEEVPAGQFLSGDWEADYQEMRFTITTHDGKYYGIFELDESQPQAVLRIEYQNDSYPASFSTSAHTYTEREPISLGEERHYWEFPQDRV